MLFDHVLSIMSFAWTKTSITDFSPEILSFLQESIIRGHQFFKELSL